MAMYYQALEIANKDKKKTRVKTIQNGLETLEFLLKRAQTNVPIYKKDVPGPLPLGEQFSM